MCGLEAGVRGLFGPLPISFMTWMTWNNVHSPCCTLRWRHNGRHSVSNHQPHHCLLNQSFRRRSKKRAKLRVTGLCVGNSPGTGEFPAQMVSNAENVSFDDVIMQLWHCTSSFPFPVAIITLPNIHHHHHHQQQQQQNKNKKRDINPPNSAIAVTNSEQYISTFCICLMFILKFTRKNNAIFISSLSSKFRFDKQTWIHIALKHNNNDHSYLVPFIVLLGLITAHIERHYSLNMWSDTRATRRYHRCIFGGISGDLSSSWRSLYVHGIENKNASSAHR